MSWLANGATWNSVVSWTLSSVSACRCCYCYSNTNFTDVNTTYQIPKGGYIQTAWHNTGVRSDSGKAQLQRLVQPLIELKKGVGICTSRTTVISLSVLLRADCRAFVTFQPVQWSYQFSSTISSNKYALFVPQFVTCEWTYCGWLRCLLEVAEYCLECSLQNVMRNSSDLYLPSVHLSKVQKGVYHSGIKVFNCLPPRIKSLSGDVM